MLMPRQSPVEERYLLYLAKAEKAREIAGTVGDKQARKSWEQIAKGWEQLAAQVKQTLQR